MLYPPELVQKIREAHDILTVFEEVNSTNLTHPIRPTSTGGVTHCPYHQEKTPSCHINTLTGTYHCFGCGAHGDVISLIRQNNGDNFTDAIEYLAETANPPITLPKKHANNDNIVTNRRLKEITTATWEYYRTQFQHLPDTHPAKQQIINRNLNPNNPYYGYAPTGNKLAQHLTQTYTPHELTLAGVCSQNKTTGELYDFWRDRLIFALTDMQGTPVSFTGRALNPTEERKYINGRTTPIFDKEKTLYNPNITTANQTTRTTHNCYIAEGQFDVIAMTDNGYPNTYAASGTAITEKHLLTLQKLTSTSGTITYILDGDQAGSKATINAYHTSPQTQAQSWAVHLPNNTDPCDYIQQHGAEQLTSHVNTTAQPLATAARNYCATTYNPTNPQTQNAFLDQAAKILHNTTTPALKKLIINTTAQLTQTTTYETEKALQAHQPKIHHHTNNTNQATTPAEHTIPAENNPDYQTTLQNLNTKNTTTTASKKLLHLAIYHQASPLLVQPDTWNYLDPNIQKIYTECVTLSNNQQTFHPENFTNPQLAQLLLSTTENDLQPLTPEDIAREFKITTEILKKAHNGTRRKLQF